MARVRRSALWLAPTLCLLLALWACAGRTFINLPTPTPHITHLSGGKLRLALQIDGQYSGHQSVQVSARFFESPATGDAALPGQGATLTCNGVDIKPATTIYPNGAKPCPRQPAGGSYTITYTDERGTPATVVVPVPIGAPSILTPIPGSAVKIPPSNADFTSSSLRVSYAYSTVPLNSSVYVTSITAQCGAEPNSCGFVSQVYSQAPRSTPSTGRPHNLPTNTSYPVASIAPTPTPPAGPQPPTPTPYPVVPTPTFPVGEQQVTPGADGGPAPNSCSGAIIKNKPLGRCVGVFDISGDFRSFQAGPGSVSVEVEIHMLGVKGDFLATSAIFTQDAATAPITWTN